MSIVQPIIRDQTVLHDDDDWDSVHHVEWEADSNFFTGSTLRPRTPLNKATADHQITLARAAALIIRTSLNNIPVDIPDFNPTALPGPRKKLFQWMSAYNSSPAGKLVLSDVTMTVTIEILSSLTKMGVEGEILAKIGPNLGGILQGTVDPMPLLLESERLNRMQDGMELVQKLKAHLQDYLACFATKQPVLNVLEIGASTSNNTNSLLDTFSDQKNILYTITDRSLPVLEQTKSSQQDVYNLKALNINEDPMEQGFSPESFDVVLVNNILYTANSLEQALMNVRKLLVPGGAVVLTGFSDMSPAYNLIFGMNENMWSDERNGQLEYPSAGEWDKLLQDSGFSTLEPATKTFDHIGQLSYCVVATAVASTHKLMANTLSNPESTLFSFANQLSTALAENNTASTISPTLPDGISPRFIYVVLDDGSAPLEGYQELTNATNILWISMNFDGTGPRDMAVIKHFAHSARKANEGLKLVTLEVKQQFPEYAEILKVVTRIIQVSFQEDRGTRTELEYEYINGRVLVPRVKTLGVINKRG